MSFQAIGGSSWVSNEFSAKEKSLKKSIFQRWRGEVRPEANGHCDQYQECHIFFESTRGISAG